MCNLVNFYVILNCSKYVIGNKLSILAFGVLGKYIYDKIHGYKKSEDKIISVMYVVCFIFSFKSMIKNLLLNLFISVIIVVLFLILHKFSKGR